MIIFAFVDIPAVWASATTYDNNHSNPRSERLNTAKMRVVEVIIDVSILVPYSWDLLSCTGL